MISVPIYEAKNKLTQFIHTVESGELLEITRHGIPVAYLVNKDGLIKKTEADKFEIVLEHWKEKYSDCFLTNEEEQEYFENQRQKSKLRHIEDFE